MRNVLRSTFLSAAGLLSAALAASAITPLALAADDETDVFSVDLVLTNNFLSKTDYFGANLTDDQIWLYLKQSPGPNIVTYTDTDTQNTKSLDASTATQRWAQLSKIKDYKLNIKDGFVNAVLFAVIWGGETHPETLPTAAPNPGYNTTDYQCVRDLYAYAVMEWKITGSFKTVDLTYEDLFSFPTRITVKDAKDAIQARSGFKAATAKDILHALQNANPRPDPSTGDVSCTYPSIENYPPPPPPLSDCHEQAGLPAQECYGIPSDYLTAPCDGEHEKGQNPPMAMARWAQKYNAITSIAPSEFDEPPFRWLGPTKSSMQAIVFSRTQMLQLMGNSFHDYLDHLAGGAPNQAGSDGYYMDFNQTVTAVGESNEYSGYNFYVKVTQGSHGYGLEISKIRINTHQNPGDPAQSPPGGDLLEQGATITILANGEPILNLDNQNYYGLWTDLVIGSSNASIDTGSITGSGPVITATGFDHTTPLNQSLISAILGTLSTALGYGIITDSWDPPQSPPCTGTNKIFGTTTAENQTCIFPANAPTAYRSNWASTLWQYQDFGAINSEDGTMYGRPVYLMPSGDRFEELSPVFSSIASGYTMIWELGIPTTPNCTGDFDVNGDVNGGDLRRLLTDWGDVADGTTSPHDLNGDGIVDGFDLGVVLSHWGPCP